MLRILMMVLCATVIVPGVKKQATNQERTEFPPEATYVHVDIELSYGDQMRLFDIVAPATFVQKAIKQLLINNYADSTVAHDLSILIVAAARAHDLYGYEDLLAKQVVVESWVNPEAVGPLVCLRRGSDDVCIRWDQALGLGQIMPSVWGHVEHCRGDLFDPETNLTCQAHVLSTYLEWCDGDVTCALNRYWGSRTYRYEDSPYTNKVLGVE